MFHIPMTVEYQIIIILFVHWVADFLFQTKWMAENKSSQWYPLLAHTITYTFIFWIAGLTAYIIKNRGMASIDYLHIFEFVVITFICHTITDYFTSRWTKRLREQEKYYGFPSFFSVIGLDQWLHALQLIVTFTILNK